MDDSTERTIRADFLHGIRVIDFGNNIAGPCATTILGGLGAEVIKVERPPTGDASRVGPPFLGKSGVTYKRLDAADEHQMAVGFIKRNRGKYSVTLDLSSEADRARFIDLVATADVMVENGLPGALVKLGVGYETLKERNPGLILCSVTGFGQTGPCRGWSAYDAIVQAHSGTFMDVQSPDAASGVPVADMSATLYAVISILGALVARGRGEGGAWLDVSMLEATLSFAWESNRDVVYRQKLAGEKVRRVAPWNSYPTADGAVVICAYTDRQWLALKRRIGIDHDRFDDRLERLRLVDELDARISEWTTQRGKWDIAFELQHDGVPASPLLNPLEVIDSPQVVERGALKPVHHPVLGASEIVAPEFPLHIAGSGHVVYDPNAPELGDKNDALNKLITQPKLGEGPA